MNQTRVAQSGKVGWIASLMRQLLQEVRVAPVGVAARTRVAEIHGRAASRLEQRLALDVVEELRGITVPFCGLGRLDTGLGVIPGRSFSRVDRLLDNIETAQFGQQRQRQRRRQRLTSEAGEGQQKQAVGAGEGKQQIADAGVAPARDGSAMMQGGTSEDPPELGDFVKGLVSLPDAPPPDGSVALDFTCDKHPGRLMRLWMSRQERGDTLFGGEGRRGAWGTDTSGRGAVLVACTQGGCQRSARLTNDWLVARLRQVRATFEAGKGLPMAWIPLSNVKAFPPER